MVNARDTLDNWSNWFLQQTMCCMNLTHLVESFAVAQSGASLQQMFLSGDVAGTSLSVFLCLSELRSAVDEHCYRPL